MHKLAKGLKKKKKQKKGKKAEEDEEFEPEELERYRRERIETQQKLADGNESNDNSNQPVKGAATANDEWSKFQALASGIDSVLKKTQNDLDRIKSTSFFQRKAPEPPPDPKEDPEVEAKKRELAKRYVGFDKSGNPIEETSDDKKESKEAALFVVNDNGLVDVPDDEEEDEELVAEDIFDTTYIDVLENIDVQLAYIPDSPTEEQLDDDPFDTTNADKVLKIRDKTGKKLVSLGNAVEVLSGRINYVSTCKVGKNKSPPREDLLCDFDDSAPIVSDASDQLVGDSATDYVQKTLLDDDTDAQDIPVINVTKLSPDHSPLVVSADDHKEQSDINALDISEFELINNKTVLDEIPTLEEDEFNTLEEAVILEETKDPFTENEPDNVDFQEEIIEVNFEAATFANEVDPFDTTIADNILPGKAELKFIEKELEELPVSEVSTSLTDPNGLHKDYENCLLNAHEKSTLNVAKKDLLGGSFTELNQLIDKPIQPIEEISYVDPFDTSGIECLPPGKTELKVLEKELLDEVNSLVLLKDDDFDPRKEEIRLPQENKTQQPPTILNEDIPERKYEEEPFSTIHTQSTVNEIKPNTFDTDSKVVAFELPISCKKPDLLTLSAEENSSNLSNKPLTPYYSQKISNELNDQSEESDIDPFDTSFVVNTAPGKTELKLIESELLKNEQESSTSYNLNDKAFHLRSEEAEAHNSRESEIVIGRAKSADIIESLINKKPNYKREDSILDTDVNLNSLPLTPNVKPNTIEEIELSYKDPFDTSYASNILPGKAELKLLENELSQIPNSSPIQMHPVVELVNRRAVIEKDSDFHKKLEEDREVDICLGSQVTSNDSLK